MKIVVETQSVPWGALGMDRHQANLEENLDRRGEKEGTLRALMTVGMSEQTAREQIMRLAAGDIWAG